MSGRNSTTAGTLTPASANTLCHLSLPAGSRGRPVYQAPISGLAELPVLAEFAMQRQEEDIDVLAVQDLHVTG
jgi:hypothetical protein